MASRQERMQQRLRGAQRRQAKEVDFELVFPTASASGEQVSPERSQFNPAPHSSARRTPAPQPYSSAGKNLSLGGLSSLPQSANANTSKKRRKLDSNGSTPPTSRTTRSSQRDSEADIYTLPDDEAQLGGSIDHGSTNYSSQPAVSEEVPELKVDILALEPPRTAGAPARSSILEQVNESPPGAPGTSRRIRLDNSIPANSWLQNIQNDSLNKSLLQTPLSRDYSKRRQPATRSESLDLSQQPSSRATQANRSVFVSDELDELSPEHPSKTDLGIEYPPENGDLSCENAEYFEAAEAIGDTAAAMALKKIRGRVTTRNVLVGSPDLDPTQKLAVKRRGRKRARSSPVLQRQPVKAASRSIPQTSKIAGKARVRAGSPIPITVYRLTRPLVYDNDSVDADILNLDMPHIKRGGVNTIDVLGQICKEVIGSGLDTLEEQANNCEDISIRREYKTKWRAVEEFGRELQTRLLEHTINLDHAYSLERRIRDEQKKKLRLREQILCVRAQREEIALRMDEVRIRHENEQRESLRKNALNNTIHDIELAVDTGKRASVDGVSDVRRFTGTEFLLKKVAGMVSGAGGSRGLLEQVKEFNAFMKRAALALESQKF